MEASSSNFRACDRECTSLVKMSCCAGAQLTLTVALQGVEEFAGADGWLVMVVS